MPKVNERIAESVIKILNEKLPALVRSYVEIPNVDYIVKSIELLDDEQFIRVRFSLVGRDDEYVWFFRI